MTDITELLNQLDPNSPEASQRLYQAIYEELRQLAAAKMAREKIQTLDSTGLVHEAYMRLVGGQENWDSRKHFFGAASEAMRRILIDRARARNAQKRLPIGEREFLADIPAAETDERLLQVDAAISRLETEHPEKAELVKLRYFSGLPIRDAADVLHISTATADRWWAYSRAFLQSAIDDLI